MVIDNRQWSKTSILISRKFYIILALFLLFTPQALCVASDGNFKIFSEKATEKGGYKIYANNKNIIPYFVRLDFLVLKNLKPSINKPYQITVPANTRRFYIMNLTSINQESGYSVKYESTYQMGDPINTVHDDSYLYFFPFQHGIKKKVTQGYFGEFSHYDTNEYAIDFGLDEGEKIYAARDGIVVKTKEDSDRGGFDQSYGKFTNEIIVYHSDGSFGSYAHLKKNGALVNVNDKVKAGDLIGYSGNTGISSGPHLHFAVNVPQISGQLQSIPVSFLNYDGDAITAENGEYYYAFHTDKPDFKVTLGKNINNYDYKDYIKNVNRSNRMNIRSEKIDDTILLFLQNGYKESYTTTIKMALTNLEASRELPLTKSVPPLSEIFLLILRPFDSSEVYKYSINITYNVKD